MRKLALLLLILTPPAALGESIIEAPAQQCVWRAGDDPSWAAPNLDESGWRPYAHLDMQPGVAHAWVRCHADLLPLRGLEHPAIQVTLPAAYQVFVNGQPMGGKGDLRNGQFSVNTMGTLLLPKPLPPAAMIALHVPRRHPSALAALRLHIGDENVLRDRRAGVVLARSLELLSPTICFGATGVIGFVLLGLYLNDPSRRDLLLLSIACIGAAANNLDSACNAALVDFSEIASFAVGNTARLMVGTTRTWFFFALAKRRVPVLFWILIGVGIHDHILWEIESLLPASQALSLDVFRQHLTRPATNMAYLAACALPLVCAGSPYCAWCGERCWLCSTSFW